MSELSGGHREAGDHDGDIIVRELRHVEHRYRELSHEAAVQRQHLDVERRRAAGLADQLAAARAELAVEQERARRAEQRRADLARHVQEVHRAVFDGDMYQLILQSCLAMTGATRGLYLSYHDGGERLRVRAAVGVEPEATTRLVDETARRALASMDVVVCRREHLEPGGLAPPDGFLNFAAVPVVVMNELGGVIVVADKERGEFDEEDLETLLSIGSYSSAAVENMRLHHKLQAAYLATLSMLADVVEAKDPSTRGHCELVSRYARLTAERLALGRRERSLACYGALLHDVGKIAVSDGVLNKPGPLLPEERELVRAHVRVGHDLIRRVPALGEVADVVLHHHERFDGSGYPEGRRGSDIPLPSRIVAVVDAYCAMIAARSYKPPLADGEAREELRRCAGTQFDPEVVAAFLEVLDTPEGQKAITEDEAAECGLLPAFVERERSARGGDAP